MKTCLRLSIIAMLALTSAPVMAQGEPDPDAPTPIIESIGSPVGVIDYEQSDSI